VLLLHRLGLFIKVLGGDGEELGRIGGTVVFHGRTMTVSGVLLQCFEFVCQHFGPLLIALRAAQQRCAVAVTAGLVQLMGELVQHHVFAIAEVATAATDIIPGQHHLAVVP